MRASFLFLFAGVLSVSGCSCGTTVPVRSCTSTSDCPAGNVCLDAKCQPRAAGNDGSIDGSRADGGMSDLGPRGDTGTDAGPCTACGAACCTANETCINDIGCARIGPACTSSNDCRGDSYCDPTRMRCLPYGPGGVDRDPMCSRLIAAGTFAPTVQCKFDAAPAGDPFPTHLHVLSTPMVVDFAIGRGPDEPQRPSIVAVFDDGVDGSTEQPTGVIRILDGATCQQQAQLGSLQLTSHSSPPAVADLDGDGRAEIIAFKAGGGLVAFKYSTTTSSWGVLWRSTTDGTTPSNPTGHGWTGPSVIDLDDDGRPEILRAGLVYDANGVLVSGALAWPDYTGIGVFAVAANVDADPAVELVAGEGAWEWDTAGRRWRAETWFMATAANSQGHVAIADFGAFAGRNAWPADAPEVAVIASGFARVQTLDGTVVFGPVRLVGGGTGGPPTIADFDGDGRREFASAGATAYNVFDLDCGPSPIGLCGTSRTDGILWTQPSQDASSNVTGSSVFDFEADGRAEAVYADECFVRVYDGRSGTVLFSQAHSSCTWYENPVVADVDGDFNAEIVIGSNFNCGDATTGIACPGVSTRNTDAIYAGLRCASDGECVSNRCDNGLCRCTADTDCCAGAGCAESNLVCVAPPTGTPGTGNTCRASRPIGTRGIRVFRDGADRWVRSRQLWNQHAYHVTNTNDVGQIPRTSMAVRNWTAMGLNNFRQNVQGDTNPDAAPDLTSGETPLDCMPDGSAQLAARICNRGTQPVDSDMAVGFYDGAPGAGTRICQVRTTRVIQPGGCETVQCRWPMVPGAEPGRDVTIVVDEENIAGECREGNNTALLPGVFCSPVG